MTAVFKRMPHPALVFVVIAWGLNFSVIKVAYQSLPAPAVGLVRYCLMFPLLMAWCLLAKQSLRYPKGQTFNILLAGFVGSGVYMVLFLEGMRTAPAALGAVALATAPVITTILSVAFRQEAFTWRLLFGSLIAFSGVAMGVLSAGERSKGSMAGVLLVLASALVWAVSVVMYRKLVTDLTPVRVLTLSFPGAFLMMVPYGLGPLLHTDWAAVTFQGWLAMAYLVIVAGVAAFAAYYKGLADVGPSRTSMTQYFTPPMAAIFAAMIIHERLRTLEIVGLLVVILGVAVAVWKSPTTTSSGTYRPRQEQETLQSSSASFPPEG